MGSRRFVDGLYQALFSFRLAGGCDEIWDFRSIEWKDKFWRVWTILWDLWSFELGRSALESPAFPFFSTTSSPHFSSGISVERAKRLRAWKSPHARNAQRGGEREKRGTTDKAQAFDPSRPTDFGVWISYQRFQQHFKFSRIVMYRFTDPNLEEWIAATGKVSLWIGARSSPLGDNFWISLTAFVYCLLFCLP